MNPVDVLRETMRSAGDSRLSEWHAQLSEYGKEVKEFDDVGTGVWSASDGRTSTPRLINGTTFRCRSTSSSRTCATMSVVAISKERYVILACVVLTNQLHKLKVVLMGARGRHAQQQTAKFKDAIDEQKQLYKDLQKKLRPLSQLKKYVVLARRADLQ